MIIFVLSTESWLSVRNESTGLCSFDRRFFSYSNIAKTLTRWSASGYVGGDQRQIVTPSAPDVDLARAEERKKNMATIRKVLRVTRSRPTIEGAGVHLKRAFGQADPHLDPFLLLDDFHSDNPRDYLAGFPWRPHRGIETITYLHHGSVAHGDSMGNKGMIQPGDVQWMTAGSGMIHEEMPQKTSGLWWGFQLWANLPAANKMMAPRYRDVKQNQIPEVQVAPSIRVKVICGKIGNTQGPVTDIVTDPCYFDVTAGPETTFRHAVAKGRNAFAYVLQGAGVFDGDQENVIDPERLVIFGDGDEVQIAAGAAGLRFLLVSGKPIREPVAWWGPIVMNTDQELRIAFDEYERGAFIKHR